MMTPETAVAVLALTFGLGCQTHPHQATHATRTLDLRPTPKPPRVYVSNERSNNVSVIDPTTNTVVANIPVGKRPRGIHVTTDHRSVFVALSGSPIAGPNVKDKDLPPADKEADGIALIDVATGQFKEKLLSGSDPEQFDLSNDEHRLYVSNEDESQVTVIDLATRKPVATLEV